MVWFKVDDRFHGSDPVKRIPRAHRLEAIGLWTLAGTWSAQFLKDGFVPEHIVEDLCGSVEVADHLVEVKLWRRVRGGFQFTDWRKWQRTREKIETERKAVADRVAAHRARKTEEPGTGIGDVTRYESDVTPHQTRPDQTRPSSSRGSVATSLPVDYALTDQMRAWAAEHAPAVILNREFMKFRDYWITGNGAGKKHKSWDQTLRNWLLNAQQDAETRGWKPKAIDWMNQ